MTEHRLSFDILPQPNDATCGPTCLHAVYQYYGDASPLAEVIDQVGQLQQGGTLAVVLGRHALRRGYRARIYTFNLQVFDPTWFESDSVDLRAKLIAQREAKNSPRLHEATDAYLEFLNLGGELCMDILSIDLIRGFLQQGVPILTGLSATFLYGEPREVLLDPPVDGCTSEADDVRGYPCGHFVILHGYNAADQTVLVADPLESNPFDGTHYYSVNINRVFAAIMLGIVTYDANLLLIEPATTSTETSADASACRL
jgi:hypothetical protein